MTAYFSYIITRRNVPATPTEMLDIESLHRVSPLHCSSLSLPMGDLNPIFDWLFLFLTMQYYEAYLWLSHRFPVEFKDTERALKESKNCAALVECALKSFATAPAAITAKKIRRRLRPKEEGSRPVQTGTGMGIQSSSEG